MRLITGTNSKLRELYEAVKREQDGNGESLKETVTCESALREAGIDEKLIGKKLKEQLEAKHPRWNPKKKAFDLFPDHDARLAALREAVKIFGGDATEREDKDRAPVIIDFTDSWASRRGCDLQADSKLSQDASEVLGNGRDGRERSER